MALGCALLSLFAVTEATVAADGTLTEPFWALALGTLALTAAVSSDSACCSSASAGEPASRCSRGSGIKTYGSR